jgi:hypothetical protein
MKLAVRTKIIVGVAALVGAYVVFTPSESATTVAEANGSRHTSGNSTGHGARPAFSRASATQALSLFAHRVADASAAGSLFAAHSWYVPPPPPPAPPPSPASLMRPKPTAPPLPYQFMGSYAPAGGAAVVFLTRGDVVYDVRVGDTLDNTYSVDKLEGGQLYLTYKPLNIQQQLNAGGSP